MKLGAIPEQPIEALLLPAGLVPTPLLDTMVAMLLSRTLLTAVRLGVFEALAEQAQTAAEVAAAIETHPAATAKLLDTLVGIGYLRLAGDRYALAPVARRWLLVSSAQSLHDALLYHLVDTEFMAHCEDYVRTGEPLNIHATMTGAQWDVYQRGMRAGANIAAREVARRIPMPKPGPDGRLAMLDIGGAHGYYSVALCRRFPALRATILDLPDAVAHAAPLLARDLERDDLGDRVTHVVGNALTAELGEGVYDLILMANLAHHFDAAQNRALARRVARALRPGGFFVIGEVIRPESPQRVGQIGALTNLYFAVTSEAGTWSFAEMSDWQRAAGLRPRRPLRLLTGPGAGLQIATKPRPSRRASDVSSAPASSVTELEPASMA